MKSVKSLAMLVAAAFIMNASFAQEKTVNVGGAFMYPSKNIVDDHVVLPGS
jgi:hypothetical protein